MNFLPRPRIANIVVQHLNGETLVYDLITNKAFCLNPTAAKVYQACGEKASLASLKKRYGFSDEIIYLALDELNRENLLEKATYSSPFKDMNRREVIKKVGLACAVALPVISSLTAPPPASAASTCVNVGGQAAGSIVRPTPGGLIGCFADCSASAVSARCCNGSARTGSVCDPGPPQRTTCICD